METLTAKGALYAEIKSKLSSNVYKRNESSRSYNLRRIHTESERIKKILSEKPDTKQKKAWDNKLENLQTLKRLIEELPKLPEGEENVLRSPKPATPKSSPRFLKPTKEAVNPPTVILGHGNDVCYSNGKLEELTVPPNCIYISFTLCGLVNYLGDDIIKKFFEPKYKKYFNDPIKYEKILQRIFKAIHIHKPGTTYVNTRYEVSSYHRNYNQYAMSGVIPLDGNTKFIPRLSKEKFTESSQDDISNLFEHSIFPRKKDIEKTYDDIKKTSSKDETKNEILKKLHLKIPTISQKELFELRPGIYYNPLCRSVNPLCNYYIKSRRASSLANAKRVINEVDIDNYSDYIKKILEKCDRTKNCDEIEELTKEIPQLTPFGLSAVKDTILAYIRGYKENKIVDGSIMFKLLEHIKKYETQNIEGITSNIKVINQNIKSMMEHYSSDIYINGIIGIINRVKEEQKDELIRLTNIYIDRNILVLQKLREEVNPPDGGMRKTRKVRKH
jgi:hypothetical protein